MADRALVEANEIIFQTDLLQSELNYFTALGKFCGAVLGYGTFVNNMATVPDSPASLNVIVQPGELYSVEAIDTTAYGTIPSNPNTIVKQCINYSDVTIPITPPATVGFSQKYLIQVAFSEVDGVPVNRPFYNAPSAVVNTQRQDLPVISAKAGVAAATGTEVAPAPDAGFTGIYIVTVAHGQTTITSGDIVQNPGAPLIGGDYGITLPQMLTQTSAAATYALRPDVGNNAFYSEAAGTNTSVPLQPGPSVQLPFSNTAGIPGWITADSFVAPWSGIFNVTAFITQAVAASANGELEIDMFYNSTLIAAETVSYPFPGTGGSSRTISLTKYFTAGSTITLKAIASDLTLPSARVDFFSVTASAN